MTIFFLDIWFLCVFLNFGLTSCCNRANPRATTWFSGLSDPKSLITPCNSAQNQRNLSGYNPIYNLAKTKKRVSILEQEYNNLPRLNLQDDAMDNLQKWSNKVEQAVDRAICHQHRIDPQNQPFLGLPRQYRGKCQAAPIRQASFRAFAPKARVADYEPDMEIRSITATQQVRQVRRIESLRRRVTKLHKYPQIWDRTWQTMQQEWAAILRAPGFGKSFTRWICHTLQWPFVTGKLPTLQTLEALEEATKAQLQFTMQQDQKLHTQKRYINRQMDHLFNYDRQAYHKVKEPPLQFIQSLSTTFDAEVTVVQQDHKFLEVNGEFPNCPTIGTKVRTPLGDCVVLEANGKNILMKWNIIPDVPRYVLGERIQVSFTSSGLQPQDIHTALHRYWQPLWNRDTETESRHTGSWSNVAEHLNQYPLPRITDNFDISSLDLWKQVIQKTNSKSAPGADGWYFEEIKQLPDQAIMELISVFEHSSFTGFNTAQMRARVVPIPKKQHVETPDQTRPITVMPTLYRLWSAVVAHQIMKDAHHILPEAIIGFVKGRSGLKAMHKLAWHIEQTKFHNRHASGLTLDLTKAFNQFPRVPVIMILQRMGVPQKFLDHWLNSLTAMEKYFDHRSWISEPMTTTTGVVEGDSLSVVGMIGIAVFWWQTIRQQGIYPMAYADNLSWYADQFYKHHQVLQNTISIFNMLRIPIDWNKTWVWGTTRADYRSWEQLAKDLLPPGISLQHMHSAVDLGVVMHYSSSHRLLKITDRLNDAMQRLHRLFKQHLSIEVIAKIIQTAIWSKAFYGQELSLLGSHHFSELRSQAAKVLLSTHNPGLAALALTLTQETLDDPEVYVILNAIRSAKSLLWSLTPDEQNDFLHIASQATGVCAKAKGPAAALKGYLLRIGAQLTSTGDILFVSGISLSIIHSPFSVLRNQVRDEWMRDLPLLTSERASVRNAPMINRRLTQQTLGQFHPTKRASLLREVCHTFQLQEQKKHWTGEDTDQCPHCMARDSRRHRATECAALTTVYQPFEKLIGKMQDLHDIHFDLPVIFCTPLHDMILQCNYNPAETVFVAETEAIIQQHIEQGHTPVFFSDGSCFASTTPGLSLAAWALVYGTAITQQQVDKIECLGLNPQNLSSSFLTVAVDRCHGDQTIDRAELWCIVKLHERWKQTTLITDSEYVLTSFQLVTSVSSDSQLIFRKNADLLIRLRRAQTDATHSVLKVRSHTLEGNTSLHPQSFYCTLGNMVADLAAKQANQMLCPQLVQQWKVEYEDAVWQQSLRREHYELLLAVQPARATLEHNVRASRSQQMMLPPQENPSLTLAQQLEEWNPQPFFNFDLHWPIHTSLDSPWGEEVMVEMMQWWNALNWPQQVAGDIDRDGISWSELAMDFFRERKISLPTRHPYGDTRNFQPDIFLLKQAGVGFYHIVKNFFYAMAWLNRKLGGNVFAGLTRGKVKSLQRQGSTNVHNGVVPRPRLTNQVAVIQAISKIRQQSSSRWSGIQDWPRDDDFWRELRRGD